VNRLGWSGKTTGQRTKPQKKAGRAIRHLPAGTKKPGGRPPMAPPGGRGNKASESSHSSHVKPALTAILTCRSDWPRKSFETKSSSISATMWPQGRIRYRRDLPIGSIPGTRTISTDLDQRYRQDGRPLPDAHPFSRAATTMGRIHRARVGGASWRSPEKHSFQSLRLSSK